MAWFEPESSRRQRFARTISPLEIAEILDLTPRAHSLVLGGMEFIPGTSGLAPKPAARALHTLRLVAPSSDLDLQQILDLLSHFTSLSTLSLRNIEPMLDLPTSLTPPVHLVEVEHLELSFRLAETGAVWLDRVCSHIDASTITSLTVHDVVSLHDDDAMAPAFHRLLARCTALRSITVQDFVYRGLLSYPSTHPTLRELRFLGSCSYDTTGVRSSLRDSIGESMNSTLGSTVQELFCELKVINDILQDESELDTAALARSFRRMLEVLDWPVLNAVVAQLRALTINMKLELRKTVTVQTQGTSLRRAEGFSISIRSEQYEWPGDSDVYRSILDSVVRNRLTLSADQRLDLRVSFSPVFR
ncbi:hypothetical protein PsYK624_125060 [Phanerochaete sordida]|uniref:F-box domain-containing protein n=1 Tax=Phanerochaete sordida TaxID=48140 RepID=A0A9P3LJK5_9APHY|nr:hypothetical protein PsYK624_125060 [Phanerochaete sordida]